MGKRRSATPAERESDGVVSRIAFDRIEARKQIAGAQRRRFQRGRKAAVEFGLRLGPALGDSFGAPDLAHPRGRLGPLALGARRRERRRSGPPEIIVEEEFVRGRHQ
jgi:hypothetical protein